VQEQSKFLMAAWGLEDLVPVSEDQWVTLSEFESWDAKKQYNSRDKIVLVVDGATWVLSNRPLISKQSRSSSSVYSGNGTLFGLYNHQKTLSLYKSSGELGNADNPPVISSMRVVTVYGKGNIHLKDEVGTASPIPSQKDLEEEFQHMEREASQLRSENTIRRENETMSENVGKEIDLEKLGGEDLEAELKALQEKEEAERAAAQGNTAGDGGDGAKESGSFNEDGKGNEDGAGEGDKPKAARTAKPKPEDFLTDGVKTYAQNLHQEASKRLAPLHLYNKENSKFLGFLTREDRRLEARLTATVRLLPGDKKELYDDAPDDAKVAHSQGKPVDNKHYKKDFEVTWREVPPGKIEALYVEMPLAGLVPLDSITNSNVDVTFDRNNPCP
jgi:TolA-binding protein